MTKPSPWRMSSFTDGVQCVAVQWRDDDTVAVINTNPGQGELTFTRAEFEAFKNGVKAGEFDNA